MTVPSDELAHWVAGASGQKHTKGTQMACGRAVGGCLNQLAMATTAHETDMHLHVLLRNPFYPSHSVCFPIVTLCVSLLHQWI